MPSGVFDSSILAVIFVPRALLGVLDFCLLVWSCAQGRNQRSGGLAPAPQARQAPASSAARGDQVREVSGGLQPAPSEQTGLALGRRAGEVTIQQGAGAGSQSRSERAAVQTLEAQEQARAEQRQGVGNLFDELLPRRRQQHCGAQVRGAAYAASSGRTLHEQRTRPKDHLPRRSASAASMLAV